MNKEEKNLIANILERASMVFSNHGCNDVPEHFYHGWTLDQRKEFVKEFHKWNGDPEEYNPDHLHLPDWCLMDFLAYKLKK